VVVMSVGDGNDISFCSRDTPPFNERVDENFPGAGEEHARMAEPGELHICRSGCNRMKFVILVNQSQVEEL
jgi:hypothetical protein